GDRLLRRVRQPRPRRRPLRPRRLVYRPHPRRSRALHARGCFSCYAVAGWAVVEDGNEAIGKLQFPSWTGGVRGGGSGVLPTRLSTTPTLRATLTLKGTRQEGSRTAPTGFR